MAKLPDLTKITKTFGRAYESADKALIRKAEAQAKFFDAIDQVLEARIRKQQVIPWGENETYTPDDYVKRNYPGWRVLRVTDDKKDIVIEEDPKLMKYSFINKENSMVYARTIAQSGASIDDEHLRTENPKLWEQITKWPEPWYTMIYNFAVELIEPTDENLKRLTLELDKYLEDSGMIRILKDPDEWSPTEYKALETYMVPGTISTRLVKPRKATDEELA